MSTFYGLIITNKYGLCSADYHYIENGVLTAHERDLLYQCRTANETILFQRGFGPEPVLNPPNQEGSVAQYVYALMQWSKKIQSLEILKRLGCDRE